MRANIKLFFISVIVTFFSSCSDDIINKEPLDQLAPETLFQTEGGFRSALDGVYGLMKQDFYGYSMGIYTIPEAIGDDLLGSTNSKDFSFDNSSLSIYPLAYNSSTGGIEGFWKISYQAIYNVNTIIKYARKSTLTNKNAFLGEALGIRALLHYNLYRFYSPAYNADKKALSVSYRFETDKLLDIKPRNTTAEVIQFILADLKEAEALATNTVNSYRISKTAIYALSARVSHETADYKNAIAYSNLALADTRYKLDNTLAALQKEWDKDDSVEIIFRIRFENSEMGQTAAIFAIPVLSSYPYSVATDLINLYDKTKDFRFTVYFKNHPTIKDNYFPKKQAGTRTTNAAAFDPGNIDIKLIRVPELYLILAESYLQENNSASALINLNKLRNARGIGDYSGADLSNEILNERRRELAFEGFRFTDLKRLGLGFKRADGSGLSANANRFALPIPQTEIDRSGITQNPGY
ncbi:membrane protein [Flavobacterium collinsii]|uniref:RagB/SusD family nutrient uptake outer membrane protein n=1 Tax=Flavobacterium collinsii TaxID=1114861 RepID=UPI0022BF60C0|nr:RagB/SusD family nutrient uptake outer membrane protein [Flavobacterium collinsii]GIQ57654.1 membrane protein [Flavobacterium collinsii]